MNIKKGTDLMTLCLESLEDLFEAIQAWLTHAIKGVRSLHLAEVGRPITPCGVKDVRLAVHILDHEILPLQTTHVSMLLNSYLSLH